MSQSSVVNHTIAPVFDENSRILILGTMPSPKSRENNFFYTHPQNRFWKVLAQVLDADVPTTNEERKNLLLSHSIALWDVLASCSISGADDSSIKEPKPNDLSLILDKSRVGHIFTTGKKAFELYNRYCLQKTGISAIALPSTSPANCRYYTFDDLVTEYSVISKYI